MPNRKLAPTTTASAWMASTSTRCSNSSGVHDAMSRSNGSASTWSAPASASSSARRSMVVSWVGACSGRSTAIGCGSKVTATSVQSALVGDLPRPGQHPAVPEVDAVEVADRHDGAAQVGRHLGERTPDLHGRKPRAHTNTATGRASPSRGS